MRRFPSPRTALSNKPASIQSAEFTGLMAQKPKRRLPQTNDEFRNRSLAVRKRLSEESDRGKVIIGAEMLAEDLELLIRSRMRTLKRELDSDIFKGFGPLSSFSGKINLAYALQL